MNMLVKITILCAVVARARGQLGNQPASSTAGTSNAKESSTESNHKRKKTASVKLRRMPDETMAESPRHFDALANMKMNEEYPDVPIEHTAAAAEEDDNAMLTQSEVDQETLNEEEIEGAILDGVEIDIIHKDVPTYSNNDVESATERELLAQLRRRPNFNYDINRSIKGSSEAFIQKVRGKVGKRVEKRGKVGKLKWNWGDHEDDWWGSGKSGKVGKGGKGSNHHDDDWWGSGKSGKGGKGGKGSNHHDDDDDICWEDDDWWGGHDPTLSPTLSPTLTPTGDAKPIKTKRPTNRPTRRTNRPTRRPSDEITSPEPTLSPTLNPTLSPTITPSIAPTLSPTITPSITPTLSPTLSPSLSPSQSPTLSPTLNPTLNPTLSPTLTPTRSPTRSPVKPTTRGIARDDDDVFEWVDDNENDADNAKKKHNTSRQLTFLDWDDDDYRAEVRAYNFQRRSGKAVGRGINRGKSRKSTKSGKSSDWCRPRRPERPQRRRPSNDRLNRRSSNSKPR